MDSPLLEVLGPGGRWGGGKESLRSLSDCSTGPLIFFLLNFPSIKEDGFTYNILSLIHSLASPQNLYYIAGPLLGVKGIRIQE